MDNIAKFASPKDISESRAYTFIDSYIYARNKNYNALYAKNKEIITKEKIAIENSDLSALYNAAYEQTQALMSVIIRVRDFSLSIYNDIISNLNALFPSNDELKKFTDAISFGFIPKEKVLHYEIKSIDYPNINLLQALFDNEISSYANITNTSNKDDPLLRDRATKFLIDSVAKYANDNNFILETESIHLASAEDLLRIKNEANHKSTIINIVRRDFQTFYYFLRQFKMLQKMLDSIFPVETADGKIMIGKVSKKILNNFNDYLVLYKHYTMIVKYLMDIVSYYDTRFYNKVYSIQSNIEVDRALMNTVISMYQAKMRNINEDVFDSVATTISGVEPALQYHQGDIGTGSAIFTSTSDSASDDSILKDYPSDTIGEKEVPVNKYIGDEPDTSSETDVSEFLKSIPNDYDGSVDDIPKPDTIMSYNLNAYDVMSDLDKGYTDLNHIYKNTHPSDFIMNKDDILKEAADSKDEVNNIVNNIITEIDRSTAVFEDTAGRIRDENGELIKFTEEHPDISDVDTTAIEFEMFRYPKGREVIDSVKIPKFRVNDIPLLIESDGLAYKQKYFPELFYFHQNDAPINTNKFRGSISKKKIEPDKMNDAYLWFVEFINNYDKVVKVVKETNRRIKACFEMTFNQNDKAYGNNNDITTQESIILGRSQYRNELFSVILEADEVNAGADAQQPQVSVDMNATNNANISEETLNALTEYCKIVFSVASTKMDVYEEIYKTAFDFLKAVKNALEQPREPAPDMNQQAVQSQPQQQEQQPQIQ